MTDEQIARVQQIRARLEKATPGPWTAEIDGERCLGIWAPCREGHRTTREHYDARPECEDDTGPLDIVVTDGGYYPPGGADAELIAHAPDDIAFLLSLLPDRGAR